MPHAIRFEYSLATESNGATMQRHRLEHVIEMPGDLISTASLRGAERQFVAWAATRHTNARLLRWHAECQEFGRASEYKNLLPSPLRPDDD